VTTASPSGNQPKIAPAKATMRVPTPPFASRFAAKIRAHGDQDEGFHPADEAEEDRFDGMRSPFTPDHPDGRGDQRIHERHTRNGNDQKHEEYDRANIGQPP